MNRNSEYKQWIRNLKLRIQQSQIKASVRVNSSLIELYWSIGADIVTKQAESVWGNGIIKKISDDLKNDFPNMHGFSETNIKYMKRFYLFYNQENLIGHQVGDQLEIKSNLQFLVLIPWRHQN